MFIKSLKLIHFRNYEQLNIDFFNGINILYGENAQGKTNVLEALHICANGKSFRISSDYKTIMLGKDGAYLKVSFEDDGEDGEIEVLTQKDKRKSIKINGIPAKSVKDLLGNLYVVVFSPEDIKTAREAPSLRRGLLDGEISKIRPSYVDALKQYSQVLSQKNALLKKGKSIDIQKMLEVYNEQLGGYIKIILKNRKAYVNQLNKFVKEVHYLISGKKEEITLQYKETIPEEDIMGTLKKLAKKEMTDFNSVAGPHRDDIEIMIDNKEARVYASQGQLRTLMLAIKIACLKILAESTGKTPVLLLDDVFSELDDFRKKNLISVLKEFQVFITTAEQNQKKSTKNVHKYRVSDGKIEYEA
ncbi:MAG: DNA replication/repair protein RecF [Christensenella sp.]|nr:DNA replication/repair protein RecF [Christensenella sp.]